MGRIMKKLAIMREPMIAVRSKGCGPLRHGRHRPPRPVRAATDTRGFAADLLQVQPAETIHSTYDCRLAKPLGATRSRPGFSSPLAKSSGAKPAGAFGRALLRQSP
jgi:hypothetical protein